MHAASLLQQMFFLEIENRKLSPVSQHDRLVARPSRFLQPIQTKLVSYRHVHAALLIYIYIYFFLEAGNLDSSTGMVHLDGPCFDKMCGSVGACRPLLL